MNLVDFVFRAAHEGGLWETTAIFHEEGAISYRELLAMVRRCRGMLSTAGFARGDRIAIVLPDCPEFVVAFLGTIANGSVAVPISDRTSTDGLLYALENCRPRGLVTSRSQLERITANGRSLPGMANIWLLEAASPIGESFAGALDGASEDECVSVSNDDLAFLLYTSGSTGNPKGVMHLHRALPFTVESGGKQVLGVQPGDRLFSSSKLFFAYGLGNSLAFPLSSGAASILVREKPIPAVIATTLEKFKPTVFFGVPSVFRALCTWLTQGNRLQTRSLRFCVSAGEKLPEGLFNEWRRLTGVEILDSIGSTEMLQMFMSNRQGQTVAGTCGVPVPGYDVKLMDSEDREVVGPGAGTLMVRGGSSSPGYWMDSEKTAITMKDGWINTGDVFSRDRDGFYRHEGRADDLFKVKGQWVSPIEIEEVILTCEHVLEAAVVCTADLDGLNAAAAFVALKPEFPAGPDEEERLRAKVLEKLPSFKRPSEFRFVDRLPRTETGKLQRFKLRCDLRSGAFKA